MRKIYLLAAVLALTATACSRTPEKPVDPNQATQTGTGSDTAGLNNGSMGDAQGLAGDRSIPADRVVYFDYDMSDIRNDQRAILDAHGAYLNNNRNARTRLEGHADERGSREYNMALGERRAQAARSYLNILGVDSSRVDTLSYGEEKPAATGHNESSWQSNRRVELDYSGNR